jgi:hypothetical protein
MEQVSGQRLHWYAINRNQESPARRALLQRKGVQYNSLPLPGVKSLTRAPSKGITWYRIRIASRSRQNRPNSQRTKGLAIVYISRAANGQAYLISYKY